MSDTTREPLRVPMDEDVKASAIEKARELVPQLNELPQIRRFGVRLDTPSVLRMALLRGLDALEQEVQRASRRGVQGAQQPSGQAPSSDLSDDWEREEAEWEAAQRGEVLPPPAAPKATEPPEGWNEHKDREMIPPGQHEVHEYYTSRGWKRYWGTKGEDKDAAIVVLYWSPDPAARDAQMAAHTVTDAAGRPVRVIPLPEGYDVAHALPPGLASPSQDTLPEDQTAEGAVVWRGAGGKNVGGDLAAALGLD